MTDVSRLAALIRRVPVLRVDTRAAEPVERCAAVAYARDMENWLHEAATALVAIPPEGGRVESRGLGEQRPHGEPSSELVPNSIFSTEGR
jgi:hypothetical protein